MSATGIAEFARAAALGPDASAARAAVRNVAATQGAYPASIAGLYAARGRGEVGGFTVPAVNVRGLTFDTARALFRAMRATDCLAAVFELNRAEVAFTDQRPDEFATLVLAAAVAESHEGPVFLQADHLMANAHAFAADAARETANLEALVREFVAAGCYNVDLDASTLVDLRYDKVPEQQAPNARLSAHLARLVRNVEPHGISVSIGGEIGEVGAHNSTAEELVAFVDGFHALTGGTIALTKVSVQTGTRHGGVVLPDGSHGEAALDFETLRTLGQLARDRYGMAGAVQHGASTLPDTLFHLFPEAETAEVHLATGFQNLIFDHPAFPASLREQLHAYVLEHHADERKTGETDAQFLAGVRKRAWGPFKQQLLDLSPDVRESVGTSLEARFRELIGLLGCDGSAAAVRRWVAPPTHTRS